jgi:hypothetical protein
MFLNGIFQSAKITPIWVDPFAYLALYLHFIMIYPTNRFPGD